MKKEFQNISIVFESFFDINAVIGTSIPCVFRKLFSCHNGPVKQIIACRISVPMRPLSLIEKSDSNLKERQHTRDSWGVNDR